MSTPMTDPTTPAQLKQEMVNWLRSKSEEYAKEARKLRDPDDRREQFAWAACARRLAGDLERMPD